jgi:hypothetical protein
MKKFLAYAMVFTLVLPLCLFSSPGTVRAADAVAAVSAEGEAIDAIVSLLGDEDVINAVILILEDGQVDAAELDTLTALSQEKLGIDPDFSTYWCPYYISQAIVCLASLNFWCFFYNIPEIIWYCSLGGFF